jgi:hypothetical protein
MDKERVHNQLEAETLIKEAFSRGTEEKYDGTRFFTHDGEFLFKCHIRLTEYEMIWSDGSGTTVEV